MRKLTTKIIGDMLMVKNTEFTIKLDKLHSKLLEETTMICKCYDFIIRFPNLQLSKNYSMMWTPEVNHLIDNIIVKEKVNGFNYWVQVSPFTFIDNVQIFGLIEEKYYKEDDIYKPFTISSQGIERKNWQDNMRKSNITETIIKETEKQLYDLIKERRELNATKRNNTF